MKKIGVIFGIFVILIIVISTNYFGGTVKREFNSDRLLEKYEYFKDLSAGIDRTLANIEVYESELKEMEPGEEKSQRRAELLGLISMYNQLAGEYNSAMSKFNYNFTNQGDLPKSNLTVLPREYKPYINKLK